MREKRFNIEKFTNIMSNIFEKAFFDDYDDDNSHKNNKNHYNNITPLIKPNANIISLEEKDSEEFDDNKAIKKNNNISDKNKKHSSYNNKNLLGKKRKPKKILSYGII